MAGEINFNATLHRLVYQALPTPQQAYLLLEAVPVAAASAGSNQPVNFSLVLDRSGSMAGEKLRSMKEAAKAVVDRLGRDDILSIVIFDDASPADIVLPSSAVEDQEKVKRQIDAIQERGGTHLSTGMRLGLLELQKGQTVGRVSSMLLLTDGRTWEDQQACGELADQCRQAGIPIYVLGLGVGSGSDWDPRFLEDLAQRSGGEWAPIDSLEKVGAVFEGALRALQGTAVTNAQLTMRLVGGLTPRSVWRVTPLISLLNRQPASAHDVQVFLGDIQYGVGQSVLAELLLPPRRAGAFRLIQADICYDNPASGLAGEKVNLDVVINFTDDDGQASQVNDRLMNIIERVTAHKLQTQALDEAAAGQIVKATQRLRATATRLLALGEVELAQQADEQARLIEENGRIDLAAAQKMRYATKRLTEIDT